MSENIQDRPIAVQVTGVKKMYKLGQIGGGSLQKDLQSWWARKRGKEDPNSIIGAGERSHGDTFMALNGVDLTIYQGEAVGIIGSNGAGKSTLLKLLSRVTAPTEGVIDIYGRIASMLEVGTGFNPEMTGRENVYLNGAILGMTKAEIDAKMEQIIDFSEVREFIDTPVKRYSSGMFVKLAFSVAAHLDAEIMIMDEVLAVGDMAFQKKCLTKMREAAKQDGRTVLYVSHNMNTIRQLCDRCIVLDKGKVVFEGSVEKGITIYTNSNKLSSPYTDFSDYTRSNYFSPKIQLDEAFFIGKTDIRFVNDEIMHLKLKWHNVKDVCNVGLRVEIWTLDDIAQASFIMYNVYSGNKGNKASITLELDISQLAEAEYRMKYIFFQNDDVGNNVDIEAVRGLCIDKKFVDTKQSNKLIWRPQNWGYLILPTPKYIVYEE